MLSKPVFSLSLKPLVKDNSQINYIMMEVINTTYGYARVSSRDQNEERQIIALHETGIGDGQIYLDKQSGKALTVRSTEN